MARKIRETDTDIIYDEELGDIVDEKLESDSYTTKTEQTFDESDANLEDAFDSLQLDDYLTDSKDTTKVAPAKKQAQAKVQTKRPNLENPFEQSSQPTTKQTYNEVVDDDYETPRMDIRPYTAVPTKKSKKRFRLWLTAGVCGVCLLVGATFMGAFGVGAGAGTNALYKNNVETGELASDEGIINKTGTQLTEEQVRDWLSGGKNLPKDVRRGSTSNSSSQNEDIITNSSLWDKLCDFFSQMFGR